MAEKAMLLETLEELGEEEFEKFRWHLKDSIPKYHLEKVNRQETVDKIVQKHGQQSAEVMKTMLEKIHRKDLVERLSSASTGAAVSHVISLDHDAPPPPSSYYHPLDVSGLRSKHSAAEEAPKPLLVPASNKAPIINISEKYKNIVSRSSLIRPGPPALYQLSPRREKMGNLSRLTVGEQNLNKVNKTILLVGERGAGKTALVNALVNHAMGVAFEDDIWFQIIKDEKRRQAESPTPNVIVYEILDFTENTLPFSLTIVDTPGYGDTRGIEHDLTISQRLLDLFRSDEGVHEINAVGLVLKASDNRLSERLLYVFDSVMSLFGKNLENNIVALITHSDGRKPKNALDALDAAKVKYARDEKHQPVHFLFNNCQSDDRTEEREYLKHADGITLRGLSQFTDFLERSRSQTLEKTVGVLNSRVRLTACFQNLQERIELIKLKQAEIKQTEEALKKHEEEMNKNEEFTVEVDEDYKDKEDIKGGMWGLFFYEAAVTCNICKENCHHPGCTVAWYPEDCAVMRGGRCTSCTNKCPASDHVKEKRIYVNKTRKVKKTLTEVKEMYEQNKAEGEKKLSLLEKLEKQMNDLTEVKEKYEQNKAEGEKKLSLLEKLEKEMNDLTEEKTRWLEKAYQHVVKLEDIALNVHSLSTHVHLDFLIEKMKEKGDGEKVQKLEEMRGRVDEGARAALSYMKSKLTAAGEAVKKLCQQRTPL